MVSCHLSRKSASSLVIEEKRENKRSCKFLMMKGKKEGWWVVMTSALLNLSLPLFMSQGAACVGGMRCLFYFLDAKGWKG